jgi:hypothetical protein
VSSVRHRKWAYYRCRRAAQGRGRCRSEYMNALCVHAGLMLVYRTLPVTDAVREMVREHFESAARSFEESERWWRAQTLSDGVWLQSQELRLAEALASGVLDPELYRTTLSKVRADAMGAGRVKRGDAATAASASAS